MVSRTVAISLAFGLSLASSAALAREQAQGVKAVQLGVFKDWKAFVHETPKGKICFVLAEPKDTQPKTVKRDAMRLSVTARPAEGVRNEVSVVGGYTFKPKSDVVVQAGKDSFRLFTKNDGAWLSQASEDARLVEAMRKNPSVLVKGTSQRGTDTTDTYSLAGFASAIDRLNQECK
jgi:hypothetical protein